jgi:hypothetical protein
MGAPVGTESPGRDDVTITLDDGSALVVGYVLLAGCPYRVIIALRRTDSNAFTSPRGPARGVRNQAI